MRKKTITQDSKKLKSKPSVVEGITLVCYADSSTKGQPWQRSSTIPSSNKVWTMYIHKKEQMEL